jgi:hypothetical protein
MRWIIQTAYALLAAWIIGRLFEAARTGEMVLNFRRFRFRRHPAIFAITLVTHLAVLWFVVWIVVNIVRQLALQWH